MILSGRSNGYINEATYPELSLEDINALFNKIKLPKNFFQTYGGSSYDKLISDRGKISAAPGYKPTSTTNKLFTSCKKALEKICGLKLYNGKVRSDYTTYYQKIVCLSPNPDKQGKSFGFDRDTWYFELEHIIYPQDDAYIIIRLQTYSGPRDGHKSITLRYSHNLQEDPKVTGYDW